MLVIRLQRIGRKGLAQFRVVVQDSRRTPTSGKVVASLGHFNPHSKETVINKEKAQYYLDHGAQPSERAVALLKSQGVKLPKWVTPPVKQEGKIRNPEKLRRNQPKVEVAKEAPVEAEVVDVSTEAAPEAEAPATDKPEEAKA